MIGTITPVWDGNEVWLVTAGAAMFAAFPGWYATMFSALYLGLVLLLVALILRGVAVEFRGKRDSARWRSRWSLTLALSSLAAPLLVGLALSDLLYGLPIDARQEFTGGFFDLFNGFSVLGGLTFVLLCAWHGAVFLMLKSEGGLRVRAVRLARPLGVPAAVAVTGYVVWMHVLADHGFLLSTVELIAILAALAAVLLVAADRDGWAFTATAVTIGAVVLALFTNLYPRLMVSSLGAANDLTTANSASSPYSLKVMTVVVATVLPLVLVYQGWTYHVFRKRVSHTEPPVREPAGADPG